MLDRADEGVDYGFNLPSPRYGRGDLFLSLTAMGEGSTFARLKDSNVSINYNNCINDF